MHKLQYSNLYNININLHNNGKLLDLAQGLVSLSSNSLESNITK